jgi:hypothetical protein
LQTGACGWQALTCFARKANMRLPYDSEMFVDDGDIVTMMAVFVLPPEHK